MELYQLKSFMAVAREGVLSRAAEKVFASQSAVSGHIKSLEEELGVRLFLRTTKGMQLTQAGQQLLEKAAIILDTADAMHTTAEVLRGEVRGVLRVGVNTDFSYLRLSAIGKRLAAKWPELEVHYLLGQSYLMPGMLQSGEVDMGFLFGNGSTDRFSDDLHCAELDATPLRVVGPPEWSARLATAPLAELLTLPWITNPASCPMFDVAQAVFDAHGQTPQVAGVSDSEDVLAELASQGMGLAMLKESDARAHASAGRVSLWPEVFATLPLYIMMLSQRKDDPAHKAFLEECHAVWREEAPGAATC